MPKYLKDTKLEIWRNGQASQDQIGAWHPGRPYKAGEVWANTKGADYSEFYALHAVWAEPIFKATFARPSCDVLLGDHVLYKGKWYEVKTIDDLTGKVGRDVKVTCQYDSLFKVKEP